MVKMNFENWYTKMISEGAPSATAIKNPSLNGDINSEVAIRSNEVPTVAVPSKEEILGDVDSIMTQLNQLSSQIKEERNQIETEWSLIKLDEELISESAWDDTKQNFGSLFSDPIFQLVGAGIAGVLGAAALTGKAVIDVKRNSKIAKQVLADYGRLKNIKIEAIKIEATKKALEEKRDEIKSSDIDEANQATAPKPNVTVKDKDTAKDKMVAKIEAQIEALSKKQESLEAAATKFEEILSTKYDIEKITGFGKGKVHKLIASAKDGMDQEIAELQLKLFADTMDPEAAADLKERITKINQRSAERQAEIEKEAKENAEKAKQIAAEDPETKNAMDALDSGEQPEQGEGKPSDSTEDDGGSDDTNSTEGEPSSALSQIQKNQEDEKNSEEAKKKRADREANKAKDDANAEKEKNKGTKQGKLDRVEDMIKKEEEKEANNPESKKIKDKIAELEDAVNVIKSKETKEKGDDDKISVIQKGIEAEKKKLDALSSKNDKLSKLKDLRDRISAKESWQIEGTELGKIFEMEISLLEKEYLINESKHLSVSDKFRALLG